MARRTTGEWRGRACLLSALATALAVGSAALAADPPQPPAKLSGIVAAARLLEQARQYTMALEKATENDASFKPGDERVRQAASALAVMAQVLSQHDEAPESLKGASGAALVASASAIAQSSEAASAEVRELAAAFHKALEPNGKPSAPDGAAQASWGPVGDMGLWMKEVGQLHTRLSNNLRRFDRAPEDNARMAAVLAAFGQATVYDDSFIGDDKSAAAWHAASLEMRDAAAQLCAAIEGRDEPAAKTTAGRLTKACDACHADFR